MIDKAKPTFKIIITDYTCKYQEYLRTDFRRYEFVGLSCIANDKELHIYRTCENIALVPKYNLSGLKTFDVEVVKMSEEQYTKHTEELLDGLDVTEPKIPMWPRVVSVTLDGTQYKFIYLEGYKGSVLEGTHFQNISDHYDLTINDPNVIFTVDYVDHSVEGMVSNTNDILNCLVDVFCAVHENAHYTPPSSQHIVR